jgi:hypothetical protein
VVIYYPGGKLRDDSRHLHHVYLMSAI